ncbi:MAG: hypothetical protein KJ077_01630 [Anaerolineae bacterium]|nr:hypothetical protein [Anaerolineae bacterium]
MSEPGLTDDLISTVATGLAGRLRSLIMALDRLDRLESGSGTWLAKFKAEELPEAATELTLRALRASADPTNFAILQALATEDSRSFTQLIDITGLGRLSLSERLNDLVQVGLAIRLIDTDHAQVTAAGARLVNLVEAMSTAVAQKTVDSIR